MKRFFKVLWPIKNRYYIAICAIIILIGLVYGAGIACSPKEFADKEYLKYLVNV